MQYIGSNIRFIFTKIKELLNSHNTDNSAHSELFKSWKRLRNPNNADIADALAATYKNGIGDVLVEVKDDTTFALEDIKLFFRPASFKLISANESDYEGIYITMDGTQGRYVAKTFADSEVMMPEGPTIISTPSELALYPAASDAVLYTPQTLTEAQQKQARTNIGALDVNIKTTPVDIGVGLGSTVYYVQSGWLKPCPDNADKELKLQYRRVFEFIGSQYLKPDSQNMLLQAKSAYALYQKGLASESIKVTYNPLAATQVYVTWRINIISNKHYFYYAQVSTAYQYTCTYCVEDDALVTETYERPVYRTSNGVGEQDDVSQFRMSANPTEDMHIATKQYVDTAKTEAQQLGLTAATPGQIIKVKTVQDGKPTEWEAADMPSQPDWNQNDETAPDYIKNRPFYTGDPVETVLVEESTVSFAEDSGLYMAQIQSSFEATVGETYKVSWDGAAYECTCVSFNGEHAIGNLSIVSAGSDTGEPFIIGIRNGVAIQIVTADTSASHTFSISGFVSEVVKIDAKYLPNTVATKSEVEAAQTTAENAQTTADNAQTTADNAQTTANNAQTTANAALPKAGGNMTGSLVLKADPTAKMEAATKQYVDANKFTGEYKRRSDNKVVGINNFQYSSNVAEFYYRATANQGTTRCDYYLGLHGKANLSILCFQEGHIEISVSRGEAGAEQNIVFTNGNKSYGYGGVNISGIEGITMFSSSSSGPGRKKFRITVDDNGVPTITDESDSTNTWKPTNLPTVTSSDSGKFLRVSDTGKWVAETILSAYEKPDTGIPKSDLEQSVQTSLAKADTAISYDSQTLTEAQQAQARANIGAVNCRVEGNRLILTT